MAQSPAFQFYPKDFLADPNTILMSAEEIGVYCLLIFHCWVGGGLPENSKKIAKLSRLNLNKFSRLWDDSISSCFYFHEESGKYRHKRLDKELEKQRLRSEKASDSARLRWDANALLTDANAKKGNALHSSSAHCGEEDISKDISLPLKKTRTKKTLTGIPKDFELTDQMRRWFAENCPSLDIEKELHKFKSRCEAKGTEYKDWAAGWRTQMLNAEEWSGPTKQTTKVEPNGKTYDPTKDIMSAEYLCPPRPITFDDIISMQRSSKDEYPEKWTSREMYETAKAKYTEKYPEQIERYEHSIEFRQRFGEAG